jgi:hypothetical protein
MKQPKLQQIQKTASASVGVSPIVPTGLKGYSGK